MGFDFAALIEGLISSEPLAVGLWQKIAPLIAPKAGIPQPVLDELSAAAPVVHAAVDTLHQAIGQIVNSHAGTTSAA